MRIGALNRASQEPGRWAIWSTALAGLLFSAAVFNNRLWGDLGASVELPGAVAMGFLLAVPPIIVLLSYPKRYGLLRTAGAISVVGAFFLSLLAAPLALLGFVWFWMARKEDSEGFRFLASVMVPLAIWLIAFLSLFLLSDNPICVETEVTTCADDVIVWWEAGLAIVLGLLAIATGWILIGSKSSELKRAASR